MDINKSILFHNNEDDHKIKNNYEKNKTIS